MNWDAIVIGSGLGGLSTAAYLAANGKRVLVCEQYDVAGGCSQTFRRKRSGSSMSASTTSVECKTGDIAQVLQGVGLHDRIEFVEMDPDGFDTFVFPDFEFRCPKGWDAYTERLVEPSRTKRKGSGAASGSSGTSSRICRTRVS